MSSYSHPVSSSRTAPALISRLTCRWQLFQFMSVSVEVGLVQPSWWSGPIIGMLTLRVLPGNLDSVARVAMFPGS